MKSQAYIRKGTEARDRDGNSEFVLWPANALELLGKAALVKVHPTLIADPNQPDSLFAACGITGGKTIKTIQAKTIILRLGKLSKAWRQDQITFCTKVAHRRNAEIHPGDASLAAWRMEAWLAEYWDTCQLILEMQGRGLTDWVGETEAEAANDLITKRVSATEYAVTAKIRKLKDSFEAAVPEGPARTAMLDTAGLKAQSRCSRSDEESGWGVDKCPACGAEGSLHGSCFDLSDIEEDMELDPRDGSPIGATEWVTGEYASESFSCDTCQLFLEDSHEVEAADLVTEFTYRFEREPQFEEDYGND